MMIMIRRHAAYGLSAYHVIDVVVIVEIKLVASGLPDDTVKVIVKHDDFLMWHAYHQDISAECLSDSVPFSSLMLNDDEIPVHQALQKLQSKQRSGEDIKESLSSGRTWPLCFKKHQAAREQLSQRLGVEVPLPLPVPIISDQPIRSTDRPF